MAELGPGPGTVLCCTGKPDRCPPSPPGDPTASCLGLAPPHTASPLPPGRRCEICDDGYFGDPLGLSGAPQPCQRCQCSGNVDPNAVGNCDPLSGHCLRCLHHTTGAHCERCQDGFYGNALAPRPADRCTREHPCPALRGTPSTTPSPQLWGAVQPQADSSPSLSPCLEGEGFALLQGQGLSQPRSNQGQSCDFFRLFFALVISYLSQALRLVPMTVLGGGQHPSCQCRPWAPSGSPSPLSTQPPSRSEGHRVPWPVEGLRKCWRENLGVAPKLTCSRALSPGSVEPRRDGSRDPEQWAHGSTRDSLPGLWPSLQPTGVQGRLRRAMCHVMILDFLSKDIGNRMRVEHRPRVFFQTKLRILG